MRKRDLWQLSLCNIFSTPTRSFLTVLGMAIGIGAILTVLTLGNAGRLQVEAEMIRLGIDKVWITAENSQTLNQGDGAILSTALDVVVTEQVYAPLTLTHLDWSAQGVLVGCSETYLSNMQTTLVRGRMLYPLEWASGSRSVLIGEALSSDLHIGVGDTLAILNIPFLCVGIVKQDISTMQMDASTAIWMPISVFGELMGNDVHELILTVPLTSSPDTLASKAVSTLAETRNIQTSAITMQAQIDAANNVIQIFVDVLKWVAVVCTLVGGIGVMNILLVSVRERRREIGIMQSLGTTPHQICLLFLLEALLYALVGGLLGIMIGGALIEIAGKAIGLSASVHFGDCLLVLMVATCVGLFFGVFPARRASALKPVDALK